MEKKLYANGGCKPLQKVLTFMLLLVFSLPGLAHHYYVDESNGLKYELDDEKHTAELIQQQGTSGYIFYESLYSAEKYVVPSYVADEGVKYKVTKLGANCFFNATNLKEVVLPATIEEIGDGAFIRCRELKKLKLNEGLKRIGEQCFKYTYSLEQITIPASVTEIGKLLFDLMENNQQLTITCLSFTPAEVKGDMSIYSEFYAHHTLVVPSECEAAYKKHPIWGKFFMTDYTDTATGFKYKLNATTKTATLVRNTDADGKSLYTATNYVLPSTVKDGNGVEYVLTELGDHCFVGNDKMYDWDAELHNGTLQSIVLPSTVKKIGWACFNRCFKLKDVQLPEQLEELSDSCFAECISLDGVIFPQSVTKIGECCFYGCNSLQSVKLPKNLSELEMQCFTFCTSLVNVVLPENCERLGLWCFSGCEKLEEITIPSKVNYIDLSFSRCTSLKKIVCNAIVPPVSYWDYLDGDWKLFRDCKLQVPEGCEESYKESEGWEKFYHVYYTAQDNGFNYDLNPKTQTGTLKALDRNDKENLVSGENYVVPAQITEGDITYSITDMDTQCFYSASNLTSISLPATIEKLPYGCFQGCSYLSSIQLPEKLKILESGCFAGSENLKKIVLPQALEKIGDGCFVCRSEGLETITIPASVKEIGKAAFGNDYGLSSIKSIYCESQDPVQAKDIFPNFGNGEASPLYDTCILYVPVGCVDKYKASEEWGRFANIKEFTPTAILEIVIDAHNEKSPTIYTLDGKKVGTDMQTLPKGIYVQGGKKIVVR